MGKTHRLKYTRANEWQIEKRLENRQRHAVESKTYPKEKKHIQKTESCYLLQGRIDTFRLDLNERGLSQQQSVYLDFNLS